MNDAASYLPVVDSRHPARLVRHQRLQARPLPVSQPERTRQRHPADQSKVESRCESGLWVPALVLVQAWLSTGLFVIAHDCMQGLSGAAWSLAERQPGHFNCLA